MIDREKAKNTKKHYFHKGADCCFHCIRYKPEAYDPCGQCMALSILTEDTDVCVIFKSKKK